MKKLSILILAVLLTSKLFAEKITDFTPVPFGTGYDEAIELLQDNFKLLDYGDDFYTVSALFPIEQLQEHIIMFKLDNMFRVKEVEHTIFPSERFRKVEYLDKIVNECISDYGLRLMRLKTLSTGLKLNFSDPYDNKTYIELDYAKKIIIITIVPKK